MSQDYLNKKYKVLDNSIISRLGLLI